MNAEEIKQIAAVMQKYELTEFKLESDDGKLAIKREKQFAPAPVVAPAATPVVVAPPAAGPAPEGGSGADDNADEVAGETIDSPIVGTFYIAPAPDADPFVKVGDEVTPDSVVCIVEAMKVMNEIRAEKSGVVKKVLVDNATPVEFGQPLFQLG